MIPTCSDSRTWTPTWHRRPRRSGRPGTSPAGTRRTATFRFTGRPDLKRAITARVAGRSGVAYDPESQVVITGGDGDGLLDALLALTDPGDEVVLTDPTYAGMLN